MKNSPFIRLWKLLVPFRKTFLLFALLIVVYEGVQIVEGSVLSVIIELNGNKTPLRLWALFFVFLLFYDELFMRLDNAIDWHIVTRQGYPIFRFLHTKAFAKFMELDLAWHQKKNSGALVGKVNRGVDNTEELISGVSWEFFPTAIQVLLSLGPLFYFSWPIAVVAILIFPLFMHLSIKSKVERTVYRQKRHDLYEEAWHKSVEGVQCVETVKIFGQASRISSEYESIHDEITDLGSQEARIGIFKYNRLRIRLLSFSRRVILVILVWQLTNGAISVAGLVYVTMLTEKLFHSFWRFARLFDRVYEAIEGVERLVNLLDEEPSMKEGDCILPAGAPSELVLSDVCFSYNGGYSEDVGAIHDLTLTIAQGEIIALVGPSGAGKTTLRKLITRLVDIQSGQITLAGINIKDLKYGSLHEFFAHVPQGDDVHILNTSIRANIAFGKPKASEEEVIHAAILAGIHDFIISELSDGYDTVVGERGKRLSGGQKQRVALARAILADRPILVFDEATSSVDAITEHEIQERMESILEGKSAIIIAHRLSTIWNIADKIIVLDQGRVVEEGSHAALMAQKGLYFEMASLQLLTETG